MQLVFILVLRFTRKYIALKVHVVHILVHTQKKEMNSDALVQNT